MKMTKKEYETYVTELCPKSPMGKDVCLAFLIGGGICTFAQLVQTGFLNMGLSSEDAGCATSVAMIFLGALLTGLSLYDDIAKIAGAGTLVPITGFANAIVAPAMEFKSEGFIQGTSGKMFTIAGPVLVFGISTSVIIGLITYLLQVWL